MEKFNKNLKLKNFIDGEWVEADTTEYEPVYNPATGEVLAQVPHSTKDDVEKAVKVAKKAFKTWSKVSVPKRAKILFKYQQLLVEHQEELGKLVTLENGKSLKEGIAEVGRGIENVEYAAGVPSLMMGDSLSTIATDVEAANYRYPIGVVGGITPFNFPMMVPCWMFPMAIATGNTFVLKPSEKTPLTSRRLVELFMEAGLPAGVLNIVNGAVDVVNGLLENSGIKAISFVGSEKVGEYVYKKGSENLKRVQALTGAKNHTIVLDDADIDAAVKGIISSSFGSAGERCMATSVLVLQNGIADKFMAKFIQAAKDIKIGNGLDKDVFLGPVIRDGNKQRTLNYVKKGLEEGARLVLDESEQGPKEGYFVGPTIFEDVTTDMQIWKDEMFAPVLSVIRVDTLPEAVATANASELANGACIFTDSASSVRYFRENIDAGMLGINLGVPAPIAVFPFSGWKNSFFGTLHVNGKDGVDFYTHKKVVTARYDQKRFK
ncbi:CoA-acylating methylmalonate-semialdehyde dehydrogenase [Ligilactobacillus sp. WILCCON 0076]|uniref:Malonate-semialdehyde dehydrogenase n=1 Tax=Ligilactobacillus ubinensis TaxID=2876789 RepID=A0A9X2FSM0_9LACO|nr:CoA-acylating methylmalonate-semialdehyde dehydrogenase [Ligilactobacillus ubinensis]MCP0888068.1 CoA-acylating methylmalonate-semialdehyde dehydrogenase [Ligilactobacillus ubinensis]